jgi:hypothetical protein
MLFYNVYISAILSSKSAADSPQQKPIYFQLKYID